MRLTELDYYAALDVLPGAPFEQIERAHRFAVQNYSADSLATYGLLDETERREIEVFLNEAIRVLGNEHLRAQYNRQLRERNTYTEEQMRRTTDASLFPEPAPSDPQLPILPPRAAVSEAPPAPPAHVDAPPAEAAPVEAKPARGWWPFAEKEKTADSAPTASIAAPAPIEPAAPAVAARPVGEDTAPLGKIAAPTVIPALDGRPIGGGELRQIREARGLRLEEIGNHTKISMSTLRAIEDSTFAFLPAPVYLKGFLRTYAKMLQIDADKVIADYMRNFDAHKQG